MRSSFSLFILSSSYRNQKKHQRRWDWLKAYRVKKRSISKRQSRLISRRSLVEKRRTLVLCVKETCVIWKKGTFHFFFFNNMSTTVYIYSISFLFFSLVICIVLLNGCFITAPHTTKWSWKRTARRIHHLRTIAGKFTTTKKQNIYVKKSNHFLVPIGLRSGYR